MPSSSVYVTPKKLIALCFVALIMLLWLFSALPARADQRLVTIHDGGQEKTVTTGAATIGEVLARAQITVGKKDLVEPALSTPLVSATYTVNIYRARPVMIVDGNNRVRVMTPFQSGRSIVKNAGLSLYDEDEVKAERIENVVADGALGLKVSVDRSVPLTLVLYGALTPIRTQAENVNQLLQEKNIHLDENDGASLPLGTPITEGMILDVWRDGAPTKTEPQRIQYEREIIHDAEKEIGYRHVKEAGEYGNRVVVYELKLDDSGKEVGRKEIQSVVIKQPKKQVEIVGSKSKGFNGNFQEALARLRSCEGSYTSVNNRASDPKNWYYGAYQFNLGSWRAHAPVGFKDVLPTEAPPNIQDEAAWNYYRKSGWRPWPACSQRLGLQDIYR